MMRSLLVLALSLLFAMASSPLYAGERVRTFEGKIGGEIACLYEWETDQTYQGSSAVCPNPHKHQRALITKDGEVYLLVPHETASEFVVKALGTGMIEREDVVVEGTVVEGPIRIVKVKTLKVQ